MENWVRKNHYEYFKNLDYPHFSLCANVDITEFYNFVKKNERSFFLSFLYVSSKAANDIKEFRYRIRDDKVIEHDSVSPSFTMMTSQDVFSFCTGEYVDNYSRFITSVTEKMDKVRNLVNIEDEPDRDDLLYITSIPWVSFTNITHPIQMNPVDSIPRISWGKYFTDREKISMPLSVQVHHGLMDGSHMGQYFTYIQEMLCNPQEYLK